MNNVTISTYSYSTQIQKYIDKKLEVIAPKEYMPLCEIEGKGTLTLLTYYFPIQTLQPILLPCFEEFIITLIAEAIVEFIQYVFAGEYAMDVINANDDLMSKEKERVIHIFNETWRGSLIYRDIVHQNTQADELIKPIIEELVDRHSLNIEGWIRFRLENYKQYISDTVERIMFEYIAYREYKEFLALLKQFIQVQEPMMDVIHVIPNSQGEIHLYDKNHKEITKGWRERYEEVEHQLDSNAEDLILSTLITIAPLRIVIHKKEICSNTRLIDTIQVIYEDKIQVCQRCEYCCKIEKTI